MLRKGVLFIFVLIFIFSFVAAEDDQDQVDYDQLEEDFFGGRGDIGSDALEQANDNPEAFMTHLEQRLGLPGFSDLAGKVDEFDEGGNLVLESGHKIPLKNLYDYTEKLNSGRLDDYDYDFNGESVEGEHYPIESIEVDGDNVVYKFKGAGQISLGEDCTFDPLTRTVTDAEGSEIEVLGFNGDLKVEGSNYDLGFIHPGEGDDDLKGYPIIRDSDGSTFSPRRTLAFDVEVPSDIDVGEIGDGMYRTFEKDGKKYSVNGEGKVQEIKTSSINFKNENGKMEGSNVFLSNEEYGDMFLGEGMEIYLGEQFGADVGENFIYISDEVGGKRNVIIFSHKSDTYYEVTGDLDVLNLQGNVFVKNGDGVIVSDASGELKLIPLHKDATFAHTIGELVNTQKPGQKFEIPAGEKVSSILGLITIDISNLQSGNGISYNAVAGSAAFQQLTGNMGEMNQKSMALVVARNFDRLGLAATEENIRALTTEILKAREVFGNRVLIGNELDSLIYVTHWEAGGSRFNPPEIMNEFVAGTGLDPNKIKQFHSGRGDSESGALNALAQSQGKTTFFFNGHGYASGMSLGGSSINVGEMADALQARHNAGQKLSDVNILTFACYQYDYASNLLNELQNRGINDFPVITTEAGKGRPGYTEWSYFGNTRSFESFVEQNRAAGGGSFTGNQYYSSEEMSRRDDPAVFAAATVVGPNGQKTRMPIEIA